MGSNSLKKKLYLNKVSRSSSKQKIDVHFHFFVMLFNFTFLIISGSTLNYKRFSFSHS